MFPCTFLQRMVLITVSHVNWNVQQRKFCPVHFSIHFITGIRRYLLYWKAPAVLLLYPAMTVLFVQCSQGLLNFYTWFDLQHSLRQNTALAWGNIWGIIQIHSSNLIRNVVWKQARHLSLSNKYPASFWQLWQRTRFSWIATPAVVLSSRWKTVSGRPTY